MATGIAMDGADQSKQHVTTLHEQSGGLGLGRRVPGQKLPHGGPRRESNLRPLPPKGRIIPLDHAATMEKMGIDPITSPMLTARSAI